MLLSLSPIKIYVNDQKKQTIRETNNEFLNYNTISPIKNTVCGQTKQPMGIKGWHYYNIMWHNITYAQNQTPQTNITRYKILSMEILRILKLLQCNALQQGSKSQ